MQNPHRGLNENGAFDFWKELISVMSGRTKPAHSRRGLGAKTISPIAKLRVIGVLLMSRSRLRREISIRPNLPIRMAFVDQ